MTKAGEDVEKRELSYTACGNASWYSHYKNSMKILQKTKNRTAILSSNPTPGHISG